MEYLPGAAQMKAADQYTIQELGTPSLELMERAAAGVVQFLNQRRFDLSLVCVVCGSGNNGGDGFAVARMLLEEGCRVTAVMAGREDHCTEETAEQIRKFRETGGILCNEFPETEYSIIVDAIFGVGLSRAIEGRYADLIGRMNAAGGRKIAVDIPSGISADTGSVLGCAFRADHTVTFQARKVGLLLYPGQEYAGEIVPVDIGISACPLERDGQTACTHTAEEYAAMLPERRRDSHKGTYGKLLVIAGSKGMSGAAYLNAKAAYLAGAGLVQIYTPEENRAILQQLLPEAIVRAYDRFREEEVEELLSWADVLLAGSGVGTDETAGAVIQTALEKSEVPGVLDADGLNLLAAHREWLAGMRQKDYIFTPHMKEMSRLTGKSVGEIRQDRMTALTSFTEEAGVTCVLKDARTVIRRSGGRPHVNLTGNPAMAKAGAGDVLAGTIAGLLAQGISCEEAAVLGVYLHGRAGDLAREKLGSYSVMAEDLLCSLREALKEEERRVQR